MPWLVVKAASRASVEIDSKRIYVLGHSLGAMGGPRESDNKIRNLGGFVSTIRAGPTRPLEDVILDQVTYLDSLNGGPTAAQTAQIQQLEKAVAKVKDSNLSPSTPATELPLKHPGPILARPARLPSRPTLQCASTHACSSFRALGITR